MLVLENLLEKVLLDPSTPETLIDLSGLIAQGKVNSIWHNKRLPHRFVFKWITPDVLHISIRGHALAIYVKPLNQIYRLDGSLILQYKIVERAIKQVFA